ncbi:MAG TPA: globin [Acidimicrobiales bacterium]
MQIARRRREGEPTPFERWGGERFFVDLVDRFYAAVVTDPLLTPMYPEDVTESKEHLALFLIQYWGGPATYNEQRGAPRLRMRHLPFVIGPAEAEAWLGHMTAAVQAGGMEPADEAQLLEYLAMAAGSLVNA